jgi:DNA polymerase-3 subunit epsilon
MEFNLERDLCFIDIEATGLHVVRDRIIQIAMLKYPKSGKEPEEYNQLVNPKIPISEKAMEITGITPDDLTGKPTFDQVAEEIFHFIDKADLAGYNSNRFDIPMLIEEFNRAGIEFSLEDRRTIDVQRIFYRMEPRTLKAAYRFYCNEEYDNAHDALADVKVTAEVLKGQIDKYIGVDLKLEDELIVEPVKNDVQALHDFTTDPGLLDVTQKLRYNFRGEIVFNFGRYNGKPVVDTLLEDEDYYKWIMKNEFSVQVKKLVKQLVESAKEEN